MGRLRAARTRVARVDAAVPTNPMPEIALTISGVVRSVDVDVRLLLVEALCETLGFVNAGADFA